MFVNFVFRNYDSYIGLTINYISKNWTLEKLLVHCGRTEGRHTSKNIAEQLYKVITEIPGLPENVHKVCTSDNAANMLCAIPNLTEKIDEGLGCVDHLLNLVVNECLAIPELKQGVDACKRLSGKTHKSYPSQDRIKLECDKINSDSSCEPIKCVKIIAPVETRWNSQLMMMRSILKLRPALERIREDLSKNTDPKLRCAIPSNEEFDQVIFPIFTIKKSKIFVLKSKNEFYQIFLLVNLKYSFLNLKTNIFEFFILLM